MKFEDVLPALRAGRKIHLTSDPTATIFTVADLLADDWEAVEEYEEVEVWDWTIYSGDRGVHFVRLGLTDEEAKALKLDGHKKSRVLGRIEESKRVEKRRKQ